MRYKQQVYIINIILILICGLYACTDPWEEHYHAADDQVNMKLWDAIKQEPRFSVFVEQMESLSFDTIFDQGKTYTLFIPSNDALANLLDSSQNKKQTLLYHISPTLFLSGSVLDELKLLNLSGKYLLFKKQGVSITLDDLLIEKSSPLYLDGKYYELNGAAIPRPNLYEYTAMNSQFLQSYIDSKEVIFLDMELSEPVGFDLQGNTIYDSIFGKVNLFEEEYFHISKEFRDKSATFILFTQDQYISALDKMASELGVNEGGEWVPEKWQLEELMPKLMESAMFSGMLEYSDLTAGRLLGITGDSVDLPYEFIDPDSRFLCSNGLAYLYQDFSIDRSLYMDGTKIEGESLINILGAGSWTWKEGVISSGINVSPVESKAIYASNESSLNVFLPAGYKGGFSLQFTIKNVLPLRYRLVWGANNRPAGIYAVYVNEQLLEYKDKFGRTLTVFDTFGFGENIRSVTGETFKPISGFNKKDYWVENLTEFGDVTIRFEYLGPGSGSALGISEGLSIDYVQIIPEI